MNYGPWDDRWTDLRALVTNGAGFIWSHVVDRLLSEGYEVTAVDNLSEGHLENSPNRVVKYREGHLLRQCNSRCSEG